MLLQNIYETLPYCVHFVQQLRLLMIVLAVTCNYACQNRIIFIMNVAVLDWIVLD
jgi:hypothetical protein